MAVRLTVNNGFNAFSGSTVNISGGIFGADFDVRSGSTVNIFAAEFYLNDAPIDDLILDQAFTVLDRGEDDVFLSGVFADGTQFDFALNSIDRSFRDSFASDSTLTITRVASSIPEPGGGLTLATMSILLLGRRRRRSLG